MTRNQLSQNCAVDLCRKICISLSAYDPNERSRPADVGNPFRAPGVVSRRPHDAARLAARAHALSQRWCQGSPFHSLTAIQTASQPKKNPRLRNGWSGELTNGMEASHTVIQTAMVTQPRQSTGRLPPKTGLGPKQYRGLSSEVLRVECSLDLAVRAMPDNVAGDKLPGDLRDSNHACLLFGSE